MTRRFQFSLRALLVLTFVVAALSAGAAQKIRADRKAAIDDAAAMVAYRQKIIARFVERVSAGDCCPDQNAVDEVKRKLGEAEDELRKLKGK